MSYFFFSCNDEDADAALRQFFKDLKNAVAQQAGISKESAGFMYLDEDTVGTGWPQTAGKALTDCHVFVPVYTPRFIRSGPCGREFFAFRQRLRDAGLGWDRIVPIWWVPVKEEVPPAIRHVVDSRQLLDIVDHKMHGMRLVFEQRNGNNAPYALLLSTLAQMIVTRAETDPPLQGDTAIDLLNGPNLFEEPAAQHQPAAPRGGPKRVHFLMLAGTDPEMESTGKRANRQYYGEARDDWDPFHPDTVRALAYDVAVTAVNNMLLPDVKLFSSDAITFITEMEKQREMVVLLVDSWATYVHSIATALRAYDTRRFQNTAIVVPFPENDGETSAAMLDLRNELYTCIPRTMQGEPTLYRDEPSTLPEFLDVIEQVLHELRKRIVSQSPPDRQKFGGRARIPVLTAPGD